MDSKDATINDLRRRLFPPKKDAETCMMNDNMLDMFQQDEGDDDNWDQLENLVNCS
jgi:hypothetical protein